jgi:hypothetical protein
MQKDQDRIIGTVGLIALIPLTIAGWIYFNRNGHAGLNVFLGGIATLALYSILYRENPIYRMAEHVLLGLATGYIVMQAWTDVISTQWYDPIFKDGQWLWLWVLPIVIMAYFIFNKKIGWMSRIPLVILSGFVAGQQFQAFAGQYFRQINDSFKPLRPNVMAINNPNPSAETLSISGMINNLIFVVALLAVLSYFLFAFEQKNRAINSYAKLGRWVIMIGFGAIFGSTIMTRFALLVDRMSFLLLEWLRLGPTS